MKNTNFKKFIAIFICFLIMFTSVPISNVYAGEIPTAYKDYVVDGKVDYAKLHEYYFKENARNGNPSYELIEPTARFTVTVQRGTTIISTKESDTPGVLYAQIGDTLNFTNTSIAGSGGTLKKCDFQVSDGTSIKYSTTNLDNITLSNIDMNKEGTYNIYLNVMDNEDMIKTEGWGNWAYNGSHVSPGTNPGGGTGSDFPGWWYYSKLTIVVKTPEYAVVEKHIDTNSGTVLSSDEHKGITSSTYTTNAKAFDGYDFIGSRAGYTWSEIANGTTENIPNRTANFDSSHTVAFHYYYYKKSTPPSLPPPGKADIVVYYKDKVSGVAVYPEDTMLTGVDYGTYTIEALPAPEGYTFDNVTTPSPQTVTVNATNNYKQVTFYYYQPESASELKPPVAVLTAPKQVYAGDNFKVSAKNSYATEPGAEIVKYIWKINRYIASFPPIEDTDKSITLWSDAVEGDYCSVEVTIVDSNGLSDTAKIGIEVLPPVPIAKITAQGKLKENRLVILSGKDSRATVHYPIDWSRTEWTIEPIAGTGASADAIYEVVGYNENDMPLARPYTSANLRGQKEPNISFKKAGKYKITLEVHNIDPLFDKDEYILDIQPDEPPIADYTTPSKIIREKVINSVANAEIVITDISYSPDGDYIKERKVWIYYDADNDGNLKEHKPLLIDHTVGKENIEAKKIIKYITPDVGKYMPEIEVIEGFDFR